MRVVAKQLIMAAMAGFASIAGAQQDEPMSELDSVPPPMTYQVVETPRLDARWSEAQLDTLSLALLQSASHGLPPMDDAALSITDQTVSLDIRSARATDAFLRYGAWLRFGLVDQETLEARRLTLGEHDALASALIGALADDTVAQTLDRLAPDVRDYDALRAEMLRMLALRPVWPTVDRGPSLVQGDTGPRVEQVRARLSAEGLYPASWETDSPFGMRLETALRRYQGRVNLAPTGRLDQATLRQLNIPPEARINQLRSNLERRRWRERELGRRHIWVNIADFHLEAWEDGHLAREHEVMVGGAASSTPEFTEEMRYIVLNPWWGIPGGSARARFRSIRRNPGLVAQHGFAIYNSAGDRISVYEIDWSRWNNGWPYRISQPPGPTNPMGEVKFIFPNRHNVYIHDTVERDQFHRTRRDFSAGCIRVQDPLALAEWVLDGQDGYDRAMIESVVSGNSPDVVWLDERIPVHIAYWTVVGDHDGRVRFLNDLYGRDQGLVDAYGRIHDSQSRPSQSRVTVVALVASAIE